jgi:hypothetical protein
LFKSEPGTFTSYGPVHQRHFFFFQKNPLLSCMQKFLWTEERRYYRSLTLEFRIPFESTES